MQKGKIGDDDVMNFYQVLKEFDGNFIKLISDNHKSKRGTKGI